MRIFVLAVFFSLPFIIGCTGTRPLNLGAKEGKLAPCPETPNCVSSQSGDQEHAIEPLHFVGNPKAAMAQLKSIIWNTPRTEIVTETDTYIHAEFTSLIFRFVDDVEFLLDDTAGFIHVRSASRLGSSDLGVNRKRIESIRSELHTRD